MKFTVQSLIDDPLIRTRLVAGEAGRDREIAWAHTCEVEDPWHWLGSGDLLMTDGYNFPSDADGQANFVRELARANIAGLALGEGFAAPPLTPEAIAAAEDLGFPILLTARAVPFVTIARVVANAARGRGDSRASRILRLYEILRRTQGEEARDSLLDELGIELRASLNVVELRSGRPLLPSTASIPGPLRASILERVREQRGQLSAFNRFKTDEASALLVPVGARDMAALLVIPHAPTDAPDLLLAQHAATIAGLEVERRAARAARVRARAAELARNMLAGAISPDAALAQMRAHGLRGGPWRVLVWNETPDDPMEPDVAVGGLVESLGFVEWPHLYTSVDDTHLLVVSDAAYESGLGFDDFDVSVGVSQPLAAIGRLADAFREARWALESARQSGAQSAVYGSHGSYFMPNTVAEGEVAVQRLLGPLLTYDESNESELVRSLQVYFDANRSWQEGSRRLGIHKQTLVYRLKKIEEILGVDLRDFGVQAELYLALRTLGLLTGGDEVNPKRAGSTAGRLPDGSS